jgi:hypothetical protein
VLNPTEVQAWSWRLLRVLAAAFIGVMCLGIGLQPLLRSSRELLPQKQRCSPSEADWKAVNDLPPMRGAELTVHLEASPDEVSGWMRVTLTRDHLRALHQTMARVSPCMDWQAVVMPYAGRVLVDDRMLAYTTVVFHLAPGQAMGSIDVALERMPIRFTNARANVAVRRGSRAFTDGSTTTHIETRGDIKVIGRDAEPLEQSNGATELTGNDDIEFVLLKVAQPVQRIEERRRRITEVLSESKYQRVVQPLMYGLTCSIPFLLLIVLYASLRLTPPPDNRDEAIRVSTAFIVLILGVEIANAALDLYFGPFEWLRGQILESCYDAFFGPAGAGAICAAFVAWYWPLYMRHIRNGRNLEAASPVARRVLWSMILVAALPASVGAFAICVPLQEWHLDTDNIIAATTMAFVAAIFCIAAISAEIASARWSLLAAVTTVAVATGFEVLDLVVPDNNILRFAIMALLAVPMMFCILRIFRPQWPKTALLGLAAVFSAFLVIGRMPDYNQWWQAGTAALASYLAPAFRFVVALYLIPLFRTLSKSGVWNELEDDERDAGTVLALTFFFLPVHRWSFILVAFAVGWLVLKKWTFVRRKLAVESPDKVPATIRQAIQLNEAELALRALKKNQRAKLAKGEIDFDAYETQVGALETKVDELRLLVRPSIDTPPAAVLSSGTEMEPWQRAKVGATYGLLLGLPWLALLLHRFHSGFAPDRGYEWAQAIAISLTAMAQWPLLGFFFGYFYPHLRGDTGLTKGLFLFLTVITPIAAATALTLPSDQATVTAFVFSALQLLIHCMLLGFFAGDYETLRVSGLQWRHVLDVHNLGSLTAWGSTLILAIGAAVATELTTNASKLIVQALQAAVPELPRTP